MAFSKMKAFLEKVAARTVDGLWQAIAQAIDCSALLSARFTSLLHDAAVIDRISL